MALYFAAAGQRGLFSLGYGNGWRNKAMRSVLPEFPVLLLEH